MAQPQQTPAPNIPLRVPTGRRPVIAVDMDEVIADALAEHLHRYNRDFGTTHTPADLYGRNLWDLIPEDHHDAIASYMLSPDFFAVLDVMPGAQQALARLQSRYDIFIATAAMEVPTSFTAKFGWLARHFPFIPPSHIVFCGDKSILRADFLIDDNPRQLHRFESRATHPTLASSSLSFRSEAEELASQRDHTAFHPQGILYTSPANIQVVGYRRVNNWQDIETLFLG